MADFSRVLAGPLTTMTLADLGADVIKVERPGVGDETRSWGPPWTPRASSYFECVNRSKRSIALDLKDPKDLLLARRIALEADVLVENFLDGTMARAGLGYEDLAADNPGLVYCSITGFGREDGAETPGYDFVVQAVGGLMSITGHEESGPTKAGVALVDVLTSKDATIGILAALTERSRTGRGQRVEVALLSSLLSGLVNQAAGALTTGTSPGLMGNQHPSIAPYETLRCADADLAVACGNDRQFRSLVTVLGDPTLADDPRFVSNPARVAHRRELVGALEGLLAHGDVARWSEALGEAGVPAGPVNDILTAVELARTLGLDPTWTVGEGEQVRHPVRYSRSGTREPSPPPGLDEHAAEVRAELGSPKP